jgi:hypothetical protein
MLTGICQRGIPLFPPLSEADASPEQQEKAARKNLKTAEYEGSAVQQKRKIE